MFSRKCHSMPLTLIEHVIEMHMSRHKIRTTKAHYQISDSQREEGDVHDFKKLAYSSYMIQINIVINKDVCNDGRMVVVADGTMCSHPWSFFIIKSLCLDNKNLLKVIRKMVQPSHNFKQCFSWKWSSMKGNLFLIRVLLRQKNIGQERCLHNS